MAINLGSDIAGLHNVRVTFQDAIGEQQRAVLTLNNTAAPGEGLEDFLQALESATEAAMINRAVTQEVEVTGLAAAATQAGDTWFVSEQIVFVFERTHPLNAAKTVRKSFVLPAPTDTIWDANGQLVVTRGTGFAAAGSVNESLGAMIDYLEANLTYTDVTGAVTVGGWSFVTAELITAPRILDGVPQT